MTNIDNFKYYTTYINLLLRDMRDVLKYKKQTCKHIYKP